MSTTWFTTFRPYALLIACTPADWASPEGALLVRGGDEPDSVRRLRDNGRDDHRGRAHVVLPLYGARSVLGRVTVHGPDTGEPPVDNEHGNWDVVEEAAVRFDDPVLDVGVVRGSLVVHDDAGAAWADTTPPPGWHMIRVRCEGLDERSLLTTIHIDIWPIGGPAGHAVLTSRPATYSPPEARAGRELDVAELWPRLRTALRECGVTTHPALDLDTDRLDTEQVYVMLARSLEADAPRSMGHLTLDLVTWFAMMATSPAERVGDFLPGYDVLALDEALRVRTVMIAAWDHGEIGRYPTQAGQPAYSFVPEYFPVADRDGYLLVADMRLGPFGGQIQAFDKVDADDDQATWLSIGDLLLDLIVAIETGAPFDGWVPTVRDGQLTWNLES